MNTKCQVFTPNDYVRELLDSIDYTDNLYGKKYWKIHVVMGIYW